MNKNLLILNIFMFNLYKENQFLEMAMSNLSGTALFSGVRVIGLYCSELMKPALDKENKKNMLDSILGAVSYRKNFTYHANETTGIAAEHGYGPLLYLLLMNISPEGLIPNRVPEEMNESAKKVWREFTEGSGRKFVVAEPLNVKHHKESYLNMRFFLQKPLSGTLVAKRRHEQVVGYDPYWKKNNLIATVFDQYLNQELQKVYPEASLLCGNQP